VAATSSSKAIATGHKRFQEWKLRRRGSSATNSSNRIAPNTVTPKKGLTPELACKPEAQQSDGGESDKENRQLINDGTGAHDESSFEELQVSYAAMSLAPSTPSSPESTAHHAAACVEHLVVRDGGGKSWEDYESEEVLSQVKESPSPSDCIPHLLYMLL
jgi:mannose-6-phosphate isomerase-like protein (cupin superfamily)